MRQGRIHEELSAIWWEKVPRQLAYDRELGYLCVTSHQSNYPPSQGSEPQTRENVDLLVIVHSVWYMFGFLLSFV